jgi:lipase
MSAQPIRREIAGLTCAEWAPTGTGTVLALHGLTSTSEVWQAFAESLPGIRVIAPDLPGRGGSAHVAAGAGLVGHAVAVLALADELGLGEAGGVTLVGHSMGAFLAPLVAAGLGARSRQVILLDGGVAPERTALLRRPVVRALFTMQTRLLGRRWRDAEAFVDALDSNAIANRPELRPRLLAWAAYLLAGPAGNLRARIDPARLVADAVDTLTGVATLPALIGLGVPVHAIAAGNGADDRRGPFLSDRALAIGRAQLPRLTTARSRANHVTMMFDPAIPAYLAHAYLDRPQLPDDKRLPTRGSGHRVTSWTQGS